ncbi:MULTISPECIES: universal stress protein [unclassified Nocardioides]|uniref:universal stress protein n=1 Tax=unclassified Nocardioides TaxID=2615069 RepID=UPI0000EB6172|nr:MULTISPECIES: universal stress protein [unclassified Nocardioides]ABL80517.1 UspA domain protein [Nocardioides sp. JS614]
MLEIEPRKVLLCVGDEDVDGALGYAVAEARRREVGVHLLHAVPGMSVGADPTAMVIEGDALCAQGGRILTAVAGRLEKELGELPVSTELQTGPVVRVLTAASRHAGVVVLQRQRMGRPGRIPTLSVTNAVAAHAAVPVVAVPASWEPDAERDPVVVAGLGDAELAPDVVRTALAEAARRGGRARLLHAWHYSDAYDDLVFAGAGAEDHEARLLRELEAGLAPLLAEHPDVPVELVPVHARPADVLVAESHTAGVVVLGRHRSSMPWGPHLGSVVRAVLRESRSPVLVVDPSPARTE